MQVSVIIPVYNAEKYVEKAVRSALMQEETGEVLFIDDGSTDGSLEIGRRLAREDGRVRIFQHENGKNLGPGATRNVGFRKANFEYIAFLDADDFYLENRFRKSQKIMTTKSKIDGVCEAVGYHSYEEFKANSAEFNELISFTEEVSAEKFFEFFLAEKKGFFHLNGLILKKKVVQNIGTFDLSLRQTEDTDFILRLALVGCLVHGDLKKPVAMVGNHDNRGVFRTGEVTHYRYLFYQKWFQKMFQNNFSKKVNKHILVNLLHYTPWVRSSWESTIQRYFKKGVLLMVHLIKRPSLLFKIM